MMRDTVFEHLVGEVMRQWIVLAVAVVMLLGCAGSDEMEVADANSRNALAKADALSSRVSDLEQRIDALEAKLGN